MKKVVTWGQPKIGSAVKRPGTYGSIREFLAKSTAIREEQEQAVEYLKKSEPAMVAILEYKLKNKEPLIVMRPLQYMSSDMAKAEDDDGFYNNRNPSAPKFVDTQRTIMPGTQLILKSLDMGLQEFVFEDGLNREHSISFTDRNKLMTQTNVFEEVRSYLEGKEK